MAKITCAVVGAGAAGSAAALSLARRGARVQIFDQFAFGHDQGSSHGPTRLLRIAYFEHPDYVALMRRAVELWRTLELAAGASLFYQTGVIEAGPPGGFLVGGVKRAAKQHGLRLEIISETVFHQRFPWLRLAHGDEALFEAEAGFVLADKTVSAQISLAQRQGAILHQGDAVREWAARKDGIEIRSDSGRHLVDRLVVAAGAWAPKLLGADVAPVSVKEKALFWAGGEKHNLQSAFLPFAFEARGERMFYGFPAIDGDGVKVAEHTGGTVRALPEDRTGVATEGEREAAGEFLRRYIPDLQGGFTREATCLYELSPDGHFMIGRHPQEPRVSFAAGLSGHGFKFAPLIGEALADLAMDKDLATEFDFLNPERFKPPKAARNNASPPSSG